MKSALIFLAGVVLTLGAARMRHEPSPLVPKMFDPDLTQLEIDAADPNAEIVLLGDSTADRFRFNGRDACFHGKAANLGIPGARVGNLLWLVESGKLAKFHPKLWIISIGQNDRDINAANWFHARPPSDEEILRGQLKIGHWLVAQFAGSRFIIMNRPTDGQLASDGIHLNDAAYREWCEEIGEQ